MSPATCGTGDEIIVDGNAGVVIVDPDAKTSSRYLRMSKQWHKREAFVYAQLPGGGDHGRQARSGIKANIEVPEETEGALAHGADGIGLYRSEFLYLQPGGFPSKQVQYEAYSRVLDAMGGGPVTIRTLDLGGDKMMPDLPRSTARRTRSSAGAPYAFAWPRGGRLFKFSCVPCCAPRPTAISASCFR